MSEPGTVPAEISASGEMAFLLGASGFGGRILACDGNCCVFHRQCVGYGSCTREFIEVLPGCIWKIGGWSRPRSAVMWSWTVEESIRCTLDPAGLSGIDKPTAPTKTSGFSCRGFLAKPLGWDLVYTCWGCSCDPPTGSGKSLYLPAALNLARESLQGRKDSSVFLLTTQEAAIMRNVHTANDPLGKIQQRYPGAPTRSPSWSRLYNVRTRDCAGWDY